MTRVTRMLALILLAVSCGPSIDHAPAPRAYEPPGSSRMLVADWGHCGDRGHCSDWFPFATGEDPQVGEVRWLIAVGRHHACEISPWAEYHLGQAFTCRWRARRGV